MVITMFIRHELHEDILILHLNPSLTEYALEMQEQQTIKQTTLPEEMKKYMYMHIPNKKIRLAQIVLNSFLIASYIFEEQRVTCTIQSGDSLSIIAKRFHISDKIHSFTSNTIQVGQILTII